MIIQTNKKIMMTMIIIIIVKEEIRKIFIIKSAIKLRRNKFAEYIALIEEMRNANKIIVPGPEGKGLIGPT
jgi:hypothetical protein